MTKKITITLEDNLIFALNNLALKTGKKKTKIIREALQDYLDIYDITNTVQCYHIKTLETTSHDDVKRLI